MIATTFRHPHVVRLMDIFSIDRAFHLVYLHGGMDLGKVLRDSGATTSQARTCLRHVLAGIEHIHSMMLIHADVKPSNIFVAPSGTGWFAGCEWHCIVGDVGNVMEVTTAHIHVMSIPKLCHTGPTNKHRQMSYSNKTLHTGQLHRLYTQTLYIFCVHGCGTARRLGTEVVERKVAHILGTVLYDTHVM